MRSPRFLWVHYFDPHHPHTPPSPFDSEYGEDLYAGEIAYVDACAGKLLEAAREASGGKELLIVIAGDHGEDLGDHGEMAHGIFLYDSTVKIPLVMACPDRLPAGITHESPASLVDVFPTILDILNVEPEGISVQGKSLLESLSRSDEPERALYLETMMPLENNGWSPLSAVIAGRYKYIRAPKPELYHTGSDPGERDNLLESEREESRLMVQLLDSLTESLSSKAWAAAREMDEETREKLASLGYVMGQERSGRTLHDPKDMLPVLKEEQKGLSLYQAGDHSGAERAFAEALAMDPTNVTLLHYRALSLFALGRVRESILLWEKALALTPGYLDLRLNLGMAQLALGAPDSALASYGEVLDANPRYIKALVGTGMALRVKGLHEEAHKAFARAVQYSPRNAEARLWLGISKGEMGDRQGALRELEEARLLDPALEAASREKAIILSSLGRTEESVAILERLASKNPSSSRFVDLGYALEVAGRLEEALRAYRQAIRLSSDSYMAYSNAGSVLDRLGRPEEAEHSLRQALSINEDFPQAHYTLGFLLRRLGRQEEAKRELMRFLELWKVDDEAKMRAREALGEKASVLSP
jgi:tetratricopeptide (TPR) repeat protein